MGGDDIYVSNSKLVKQMSKQIILILSMIFYCQFALSQDNFTKGITAVQQKKYLHADSLFTERLNTHPHDVNAAFNKAILRLQLGDTCYFCKTMYNISLSLNDMEALKLFTSTCGKIDSLYYNDDFEPTTVKKPRYLVVSYPLHCDNSYEVNIHDNKRKNVSAMLTPNPLIIKKTNIIANYRQNNDGTKTYLFLSRSTPEFPGGSGKKELFKKRNANVQQIKNELNLYQVVVRVEYIIDKTGNLKDLNVVGITGNVNDEETKVKLIAYVSSYFMKMPKHIPAKFRNENVDFLVKDRIVYW